MAKFSIIHPIRYYSINSLGSIVFSDKAMDRAIVGSFALRREEAARKLLHPPMIGDTLTTSSLSITGLIRASTSSLVLF